MANPEVTYDSSHDKDSISLPKTHENGYQGVVDSMDEEIIKAMDKWIYVEGSEVITNYLDEIGFPREKLKKLLPGERATFEIKRDKVKNDGRRTVVGPIEMGESPDDFFGENCFYIKGLGKLRPGEISLVVVIEVDKNIPTNWKVHAEQLQYPYTGYKEGSDNEQLQYPESKSVINSGVFYRNSNVSDMDFQNIIKDRS